MGGEEGMESGTVSPSQPQGLRKGQRERYRGRGGAEGEVGAEGFRGRLKRIEDEGRKGEEEGLWGI